MNHITLKELTNRILQKLIGNARNLNLNACASKPEIPNIKWGGY
jgi:hypothetical protein